MDQPHLRDLVAGSLADLIEHEWTLAMTDVGERSTTSHLFRFMAARCATTDWDVDHEYNRNVDLSKAISFGRSDDTGEKRIYPDIILHRRGRDENLLVIEAKKGFATDEDDFDKVKALVASRDYHYELGLLLAFGIDGPGWSAWWDHPQEAQLWNPAWSWVAFEHETGLLLIDGPEPVFESGSLAALNSAGLARARHRIGY